jgi:restriction system protein
LGGIGRRNAENSTVGRAPTYTDEAIAFAKSNEVDLIEGRGLLERISKRSPKQQKALLDIALEGEFWRPTCGTWGVKMIERQPRHTQPVRFTLSSRVPG